MLTISNRNVNGMWSDAVKTILEWGTEQPSRNGPVLVAPCPVVSVYQRPQERVLFDPRRDANPFFHLFESLWMLAGRDDAAFLDRFVGDFGARYAEPHGKLYGAYGMRWRGIGQNDQIAVAVRRLKKDPSDRRTVIAMWDQVYDLFDIDDEPLPKDIPCNTHIYLRVRRETLSNEAGLPEEASFLDLTVCCRSNDIVWGAYGANAVHFSVLHEYLAGRIGVRVGTMYQLSNNWHAYKDVLQRYLDKPSSDTDYGDPYLSGATWFDPMGTDWEKWDDDLIAFMRWTDEYEEGKRDEAPTFTNSWFEDTAAPMYLTHRLFKRGDWQAARNMASMIQACDWNLATVFWLERRKK